MRLLWLLLLGALLLPATPVSAGHTLTIGRPTLDVQETYRQLQPITRYLAMRLADYGVTEGSVVLDGKNSLEAMVALVREGALDMVLESPYPSLAFINDAGMDPLMLVKRRGVLEYSSYIFTRKDSGITSLDGLKGKIIAFEDPVSSSAYHLPRNALEKHGLQLISATSPNDFVSPDSVGFVFAGSELNISSWVYFGKVDAGAFSNLDWDSQTANPLEFRHKFRILLATSPVPSMLLLVRRNLDPALLDALKRELTVMAENPAGKTALDAFDIDGFIPIQDPASYTRTLTSILQNVD